MGRYDDVSWRNPRVLGILLLVFLCGAIAGALTMRPYLHSTMHPAPPTPAGIRELTLQKLQRELDLDPTQTEKMRMTLDDFFTYLQTLEIQMNDVRAEGKSKIQAVLREDQKKKFEKLIEGMQGRPRTQSP